MMKTSLRLKKIGLEDFDIYLNPKDEGLSNQILKYGIREPINSYYISKMIRKEKPYVLDVGGNIGYFPLIEVLNGAVGVTVFEPVAETYKFLVKNLNSFSNVTCHFIGLSDKKGIETIYIPTHRNLASMQPCESYLKESGVEILTKEKVAVTTLSDVCNSLYFDNIFCRMDVEGYETKILKQVPENIRHLSFEFHTKILGQKNSNQFINDLEDMGFKIILMTRELEGLIKLFKIFGFKVFEIWNKLKEKRIYKNPTKKEVLYIISLEKENPHIFMSR